MHILLRESSNNELDALDYCVQKSMYVYMRI